MASPKSEIIKALGGAACAICEEVFSAPDLHKVFMEAPETEVRMSALFDVLVCAECLPVAKYRNAESVRRRKARMEEEARQMQMAAAQKHRAAMNQLKPNSQNYIDAVNEHADEIREAERMWDAANFETD